MRRRQFLQGAIAVGAVAVSPAPLLPAAGAPRHGLAIAGGTAAVNTGWPVGNQPISPNMIVRESLAILQEQMRLLDMADP